MNYKSNSKVVATYSKRKQFVRIVRDNWHDAQRSSKNNVFDVQRNLTSTPISNEKTEDLWSREVTNVKPLNLMQSGSFDTPLEGAVHPRQVSGKRACRKSPALSFSPEPLADSLLDLFESNLSSQCSVPGNRQLATLGKTNTGGISSFGLSKSTNMCSMPLFSDTSDEKSSDSLKTEQFSVSSYKTPNLNSENTDPNVNHSRDIVLREGSPTKEKPKTSPGKREPSMMSAEEAEMLEEELSRMSVQDNAVETSALEMSIKECISENRIADIDRSLMLATGVPSYTKLLSQCRRVSDLTTLLQDEVSCIRKIGEGSFGEVFMGVDTVYKIMPVGGSVEINEVEQTTFENAFQEIVVSRKLSDLAGDSVQMGKAFCQLKDVVFCKGRYPQFLLDAWDQFARTENERPDSLPDDQMYVVLLSKYSGVQLEDYCRDNALKPDQAHSIVRQITCSLAAAEQRYEFEHRDLHWGNVLIVETDTKLVEFTQDGKNYILKSHGLLATIIDFTFSRLETEGCLNFVDMEQEEWIFQGDVKVDIQFRVYRDMRSACRKNWAKFTPKTNVLWIQYLLDKMNLKIKSPKLRRLRQTLQSCKSASTALPLVFRSL